MTRIDARMKELVKRVNGLSYEGPFSRPSLDYQAAQVKWPSWSSRHGIYCFENDAEILCIGRALCTTLRQRIFSQCNEKKYEPWKKAITSPSTIVHAYAFSDEEWFWVAAFEAILNAEFDPHFTKRSS